MKLMIASDIHGSAYYCEKLLAAYDREKADKLLLLGDILYHGPRNDLPKEYAPKQVIAMLNARKQELLCVRGNCDSLTDLYDIPTQPIKELDLIKTNNLDIYITHGHIYNEDNWDKENTILIQGHTHRPKISKKDNNIYINPGSISLPRGNNLPSYLIFNEKEFIIYDILDNIIDEINI